MNAVGPLHSPVTSPVLCNILLNNFISASYRSSDNKRKIIVKGATKGDKVGQGFTHLQLRSAAEDIEFKNRIEKKKRDHREVIESKNSFRIVADDHG